MIEVITKSVMFSSCDRCGHFASLSMTRDDVGHQALLCQHCIDQETKEH